MRLPRVCQCCTRLRSPWHAPDQPLCLELLCDPAGMGDLLEALVPRQRLIPWRILFFSLMTMTKIITNPDGRFHVLRLPSIEPRSSQRT
jgi:hypothetical protein